MLTVALSAAIFYQLFTGMPTGLFRDPLLNLLASVQTRVLLHDEASSLEEISARFAALDVKLTCSQTPSEVDTTKHNLILVMLESTTSQYVSLFGHPETTWPRLEKYRDRMDIFPFFFSCFPAS